ncbi:MAG: carbohydrate binding domain-containing protein [Phycisphaerales bacterium]|nr:carbohydrate binding domain-containing protein [Phycisphaerales bacterium]
MNSASSTPIFKKDSVMKKASIFKGFITLIITGILGVAIWVYCYPMSESIENKEIGFNGSFELTKNNLPLNWLVNTVKTTGDGDFSILVDDANAKEGKQSLHFSVLKCSEKGGRFSPGIAQEIPAQAGQSYKLSFWVKNQASTFSITINGVNALEQQEGASIKSADTINEWKMYEMSYTMDTPMKRLRLIVAVLSPGNFWIDDIRVALANKL